MEDGLAMTVKSGICGLIVMTRLKAIQEHTMIKPLAIRTELGTT